MQDVFAAGQPLTLKEASRHGLGHLTRVYGSAPVTAGRGAAELVRQQRRSCSRTIRLGVPALVHEECLTGLTSYGATVYPTALAWGATFDPALVERMAPAIGRDMAALGVHQGLSPVLDVVRDYRWGRVEETIGEDPYLVSMLGAAYVRGLQGAGVIATLKHFAGYSASRAARNHGPVSMGRRELLDVILPPFETAVARGRRGLGDELLRRHRRRARRRRPLAAHRGAARRVGLRRHGGLRLLGRPVPRHDAPGRRRRRRGRRARARPPASTSSCRTPSATAQTWSSGRAGRAGRGAGRPGRAPAADAEGRARAARPGLDARGSVRRGRGHRPRLAGQPGARRASWPSSRSCCSTPARALPLLGDGPAGAAADRRGRPVRRRPADVHGLLRLPQPRAAAPPGHRPRARPCRARSPRCGRSCPASRSRYAHGLRDRRRRPVRLRRRRRRGPGRGPLRRGRRRPAPACSGGARRARAATPRTCGCPACRPTCSPSCSTPARPSSWSSSPDGRTRSATSPAAPPGWCRRSCRARRAARRSPACCPAGCSPAASCRCRSRGTPAASRAPTCSRRSAAPRAPASARSTRRRCSRSGTARRTPRFELDDRAVSTTEVATDGEFDGLGARPQHRRPRRRRGRAALPARRRRPGGPAGEAAGRIRPGRAGRRRGGARSVPRACRPDSPTPNATSTASSSPATWRSCSGTSAADLPCRTTVRVTGPTRVVGTTGG